MLHHTQQIQDLLASEHSDPRSAGGTAGGSAHALTSIARRTGSFCPHIGQSRAVNGEDRMSTVARPKAGPETPNQPPRHARSVSVRANVTTLDKNLGKGV
jgi:hypothetical protein